MKVLLLIIIAALLSLVIFGIATFLIVMFVTSKRKK